MSIYKNKQGRWLTKALFYELTPAEKPHAVFTMKEEDHVVKGKTFVSLRARYLTYTDPTEYEFAQKELGGWSHWQEMLSCTEIADEVEQWRAQHTALLKSQACQSIWVSAMEGGSFQACKWLVDEGWKDKPSAGRPKKADITKAAKQAASTSSAVARGLELINGKKA